MKFNISLFCLLTLLLGALGSHAQSVAVNGVSRDTYGGVYELASTGIDLGFYWWMSVEPNETNAADLSEGFIATSMSLLNAWDEQNAERFLAYEDNPSWRTTALPLQARVIEYVLDTYIPWDLTGVDGRFEEQNFNAVNYGQNLEFYNKFFTIQNFIAEAYASPDKVDYSDLSDFNFNAGNATGNTDSTLSRNYIFDQIVSDVEAKAAADFFSTYSTRGTYRVLNTLESLSDENNYQDGLFILVPAPEPGSALLTMSALGVWGMRRRRSGC